HLEGRGDFLRVCRVGSATGALSGPPWAISIVAGVVIVVVAIPVAAGAGVFGAFGGQDQLLKTASICLLGIESGLEVHEILRGIFALHRLKDAIQRSIPCLSLLF